MSPREICTAAPYRIFEIRVKERTRCKQTEVDNGPSLRTFAFDIPICVTCLWRRTT
jgi:hypothetical protein